jgi:putative SOS response-associated peptidase YedK
MCGRFVMVIPVADMVKRFRVTKVLPTITRPSYNIAPSQDVVTVTDVGGRQLFSCRWGFIPAWAKDPSIGNKLINARSETVSTKPAFRHAFKTHRCLVVANGFYEWENRGGKKFPVYIRLKSKEPFAFAGLFNVWESSEGDTICTCVIITTQANDLIQSIHERMPVILPKDKEDSWLDPNNEDKQQLLSVLAPYSSQEMEFYPVSPSMNSPAYDSPENIRPA